MLYCIFHLFPLNGRRFDYGVNKDFVDKIVVAYLRGRSEITYIGKDYSVGSRALQIYEAPVEMGNQNGIEAFFNQMGYMNESVLDRYCRNVTKDFLLDREWGELKEDYFNVYVNDGDKKPIIIVLTKAEVDDFHSALSGGATPIFVSGRLLHFKQPKTIKIYDISFEFLEKNRSDIKERIKKWVNENNQGKWNIKILERFGKDVTSDFSIKPFTIKDSKEVGNPSQIFNSEKGIEIERKIFISHSSKDRDVVNALVEKILRLGLEIPKEKIFCTSIEGMGIRTGEDFRDKIRKELCETKIVILIISLSYKASEICLNEMGAAWVLNKKVIPIIIGALEHNQVGALHITDHIDRLDVAAGVDNFIHTLCDFLELKDYDFRNLNKQRDVFLKTFQNDTSQKDNNDILIKGRNRQIQVQPHFEITHSSTPKTIRLYNKGLKASKLAFAASNLKGKVKFVPDKQEVDSNGVVNLFLGDEFDVQQNSCFELHFSYSDIDGRRYQQTYIRRINSSEISPPELISTSQASTD